MSIVATLTLKDEYAEKLLKRGINILKHKDLVDYIQNLIKKDLEVTANE